MDDIAVKRKAFAYIVRNGRLAVFRHIDFPEAGIQVPAGSMRDDESPEDAVLREAREETGLDGLRIVRFLGRDAFDRRLEDVPPPHEIHDRWFFELAIDGPVPDGWEAAETDPSTGDHVDPIRFAFWWMPLAETESALIAGHGRLIDRLQGG